MALQQTSKAKIDDESNHIETSTAGDDEPLAIDSEAERKLLRKCDLRLLPPLMLVCFLSFMDRTNIGSFLFDAYQVSSQWY